MIGVATIMCVPRAPTACQAEEALRFAEIMRTADRFRNARDQSATREVEL